MSSKQLRDYQEQLVLDVRKAYQRGYKRPCIVLPCGGGKSCITAEIARRTTAKGNRVLYLIHRQELQHQIQETFADWDVDLNLCQIMMVQTACRRINKIPAPKLIITDENHHCVASTYRKIYEAFPHASCLGVTATPIRLNGGGLGDVNDILVEGVSTKWLIKHNHLAPYDYYAPPVTDLSGLHTKRGEYVASEIEEKMNESKVYGDVIKYYKQLAGGRKAICYCATINHSEQAALQFRHAGIPAAHIDGKTSKAKRDEIIQKFRDGEIKILTNVDIISEGFDVPDCSCAILLRPTKSLTLYIQQSMRCMRYQPGKKAIIIDHVNNFLRHGMPDDERKWELQPKKEKKNMVSREHQIKICPECFRAYLPAPVCPYCGYAAESNSREIEEDINAQLVKIEGFSLHYDSPKDCKSYHELLIYAQKHGYKRGWAWYQAKARGFIA